MERNLEEPSIAVLTKCLQDVNIYEPNMNKELMLQIYHVLNESKVEAQTDFTAQLKLDPSTSTDKPSNKITTVGPQQSEPAKKTIKQHQKQRSESKISRFVPITQSELASIDPLDSVPVSHPPLKRVKVKRQYNLPFYQMESIGNVREAVKHVERMHDLRLQRYAEYQRKSLIAAPWGKPIQSSIHFNGTLDKYVEKMSVDEPSQPKKPQSAEITSKDTSYSYISLHGRQTKRKVYTEDVDVDGDSNNDDDDRQDDGERGVKKPRTQVTKEYSSSTKRCAGIGSETPKRSKLHNSGKSRVEKMFDTLAKDEEDKKKAEHTLEKFYKSIPCSSSDEGSENAEPATNVRLNQTEEPVFTKRRISPPLFKQTNRGRGANSGNKGKRVKLPSKTRQTDNKYASLKTATATSTMKKGACPICEKEFTRKDLLVHASECISDCTTSKESSRCEFCEQVIAVGVDYETHVRDCIVTKCSATFD